MSRGGEPAPLFVDTFAFAEWLLGRFAEDPRPLAQSVCNQALDLLDAVVLALKGRRREDRLEAADECLICLRIQLRLAAATGCLAEAQLVHALGRADAIGRQLGGWLRALEPV